MTYITGG